MQNWKNHIEPAVPPLSFADRRGVGHQTSHSTLWPSHEAGLSPLLQPRLGSLARKQSLRAATRKPAASLADANGHHVKFFAIDRLKNGSRRKQRNLMLTAPAPEEK